MIELLESLQFWHWWVFAGALVVVETLLPSGILYGAAVAAFIVGGGLAADVGLTWQIQAAAWGGLTVVLGWAGRAIRNRSLAPKQHAPDVPVDGRPSHPKPSAAEPQTEKVAEPQSEKVAEPQTQKEPDPIGEPAAPEQPMELKTPVDLVGGVYTIWAPISDGIGTIKIKGAAYNLTGPELPAGSRIKITADDGTTLTVEAAE